MFRLLQKVEAKKKQSKAKYQESKLLKESAQSTLKDRQPTDHASSSPERNHDAGTAEDVDTHSEDDEDVVKDEQADTVGKLQSVRPVTLFSSFNLLIVLFSFRRNFLPPLPS